MTKLYSKFICKIKPLIVSVFYNLYTNTLK
nr:MAG TPA: hypothetical protein [Caudoviricetes sp.]